jgi:hypothetical protein
LIGLLLRKLSCLEVQFPDVEVGGMVEQVALQSKLLAIQGELFSIQGESQAIQDELFSIQSLLQANCNKAA